MASASTAPSVIDGRRPSDVRRRRRGSRPSTVAATHAEERADQRCEQHRAARRRARSTVRGGGTADRGERARGPGAASRASAVAVADAGLVERGHLAQRRAGAPRAPAGRRARPCPRRAAGRSRRSARGRGARARRAAAGSVDRCPASHHSRRAERDPLRDERRGARHDAVEQHRRTPCGGAARRKPGHRRDVGAADGGQQRDRVARERPPAAHRVAHRGGLAHPGRRRRCRCRVRRPRPASTPVEQPDEDRGGRGVADAHVAGDEQVGAARRPPRRRSRTPSANALLGLARASARPRGRSSPTRGVPCGATTSSGHGGAELGAVDVDRDVDHAHARAVLAGEHVHARRRRRGS